MQLSLEIIAPKAVAENAQFLTSYHSLEPQLLHGLPFSSIPNMIKGQRRVQVYNRIQRKYSAVSSTVKIF